MRWPLPRGEAAGVRPLIFIALMGCSDPQAKAPPAVAKTATPAALAVPSASVSTAPAPSASEKLVVHMIPLGDVPLVDLETADKGLRAQAPFLVKIEERRPLPESARTEKARYSADALLAYLQKVSAKPRDKVLGVTDIDIVTEKNGSPNWGILGLGDIAGKTCVISTFRIRRKWEPGGGANEALVRERLWKISIHELGHTLGLPHCPNKGCLMQDAHGTVKTVDDEHDLCTDCGARFSDALR